MQPSPEYLAAVNLQHSCYLEALARVEKQDVEIAAQQSEIKRLLGIIRQFQQSSEALVEAAQSGIVPAPTNGHAPAAPKEKNPLADSFVL